MPPFNPAARALARLVTNRNPLRQLARDFPSYNQIRRSSSMVRNNAFSSVEVGRYKNCNFPDCGNSSRIISNIVLQKRGFLGCGDGEEGNMLSKVHEERRVLGYSPEQLFNVVAAVDMYEEFLPWCQRSQIIRNNPDGSFDAELEIGFKFLVESYLSHVELTKPKYVKVKIHAKQLGSPFTCSYFDGILESHSQLLLFLQISLCMPSLLVSTYVCLRYWCQLRTFLLQNDKAGN